MPKENPKGTDERSLFVRIDSELWRWLRLEAANNEVSVKSIVVDALRAKREAKT